MRQTALFVDDDLIFLRSVQRLLGPLDITTLMAGSVAEARQLIAATPELDVAFLDYRLPDGCGLDLVGALKAAHPLSSSILFTGSPTLELTIEALNLGVQGCLLKSCGPNEIRLTCLQALERTQLLRERARLGEQERTMKARLVQAASEWHRTFDSVDSPIVLVDADGVVQRLNHAAQQLIAAPYPQILGRELRRLPGEPWSTAAELIDAGAVSSRQAFDPAAHRTWDVTVNRLAADKEADLPSAARFVVTAREVTALLELQTSVEHGRIMAAMGALVGEVAHEVRNPLFALSATLDIIDARPPAEPELRRHLDTFRAQIGRVRHLMHDLLEYGKPSAIPQPAPFDLSDLVTEGVLDADSFAHERGIALNLETASPTPIVEGDRARLGTAVLNLIRNAIQHAPANSVVRVGLRRLASDPNWVECAVSDSGPGFSEEDLPKIFLPFFSRRESGTGLGLAIVQNIVEGHGGKLSARNLPSGGALVSFRLPVLDRGELPASQHDQSEQSA